MNVRVFVSTLFLCGGLLLVGCGGKGGGGPAGPSDPPDDPDQPGGAPKWSIVASPSIQPLEKIHFVDENHGWLFTATDWFATDDGGKTWTTFHKPEGSIFESAGTAVAHFQVFSPTALIIGMSHSANGSDEMKLWRTLDGGTNWEHLTYPVGVENGLIGCYFADILPLKGSVVYAHFDSLLVGRLDNYITRVDFAKYDRVSSAIPTTRPRIAYFDFGNRVRIVSAVRRYPSGLVTDDGTTWKVATIMPFPSQNPQRVAAISADNIVGILDVSVMTSNGASFWSGKPLNDLSFPSAQYGWVVGDGGAIFRTTNGCLSWQADESPVQTKLTSVCFLSETSGWACGANGTLLRYH